MAEAAAHRAVDGTHTWTSPHAHLAHLAHHITPEDTLEHQPLVSHDLVLVSDARIDNRDDLIPILRPYLTTDHPTSADLILAAYRHWGDESPAHLIGDYAYAIWNISTRTLFATRDPLGMRALYYHITPYQLTFATEIKQILQAPDVPIALDEMTAIKYLIDNFDTPDTTHYAGIAQVPAAHTLHADEREHHTRRYWDIDPHHLIRYKDERDYTEHFLDIFKEAVRTRTRTTTPIGILLSGGMDSGAIASTLGWLRERGHTTPSVHTYSWAFDTLPQCDERAVSDLNARHYGFAINPVSADEYAPLARYPDYGPDRDEPLIGVYQPMVEAALAHAKADGVGLMLSGNRGDLMTGAWVFSYLRLLTEKRWAALAHELREHAQLPGASMAGVLLAYIAKPMARALLRRSRSRVASLVGSPRRTPSPERAYPPWIGEALLRRIGVEGDLGAPAVLPPAMPGYTRTVRQFFAFLPMHMRTSIWTERTNARFGQGLADPWSDRRLAEFVIAIPQQVLNPPGRADKRFVREAMRGIMPETVRENTAKVIPSPLYTRSLRETAVDTIRSLTTDTELAKHGFADEAALRAHYERVRRGDREHPSIWSALTMEMWLRRYWR